MARIILQYFFSLSKSSSMVFIPTSLFQRSDAFVNAFFFERYLQVTCRGWGESRKERGMPETHQQSERSFRAVCKQVLKSVEYKMSIREGGEGEKDSKEKKKRREKDGRKETSEGWIREMKDERGEITSSPVLVESSLALITQMLGKDGLQGPHATRSLHITHHPNHHQWRRLNNGYWLHHFMLMALWMEEIRCSTEINILQSLLFFTAYLILDGSFLVRCGSFLPCSPCRRWDDKAWTDHLWGKSSLSHDVF